MNNKRWHALVIALCTASTLHGQSVGINATGANPEASSILDVSSTTKGFLAPRMTASQRLAILSPVKGLTVFQTDGESGYWVYDTVWKPISQSDLSSYATLSAVADSTAQIRSEIPSATTFATKVEVDASTAAIAINTAKVGITLEQASAITANTAKVGITLEQASAITTNTAKVGITTEQASAITTNTAKVGITTEQASAITANTAKVGITTDQANAIIANTAKVGITTAQADAITANTAGLALKAPIASPAFTGTVTAPTLIAGGLTYPTTSGTTGQVLTTNGAGAASWANAAGGLTNFSESNYGDGTTINYGTKLLAKNDAQTNVDFVFQPKGTGAILAQQPTGNSTGGNKRGGNVVDLQTSRGDAAQVASGLVSTVSGGQSNTASGNYSIVSGGQTNTASGLVSTVSGGMNNAASGSVSTVSGGQTNTASGLVSTVSGGQSDTASGNYSIVSGGQTNTASGDFSIVSGGQTNTASGLVSTVSGGLNNAASGVASTISGGSGNTASGTNTTVSGGYLNTASSLSSTVSGGQSNTASGTSSTVSGGQANTASGVNSFAAGFGNSAPSYGEVVMGYYATVYTPNSTFTHDGSDRLFVLGNGISGTRSNALTLLKNGNMTIAGTLTTGAVTYPSAYGTGNQLLKMNAGGNALEWGTAGGLTNFTESNYGNGTTINYGTKLLAKNDAQANVDFAIQPKGTGAILAQQPDGTATGGNNRGANAVDLQTIRSTVNQVASGQFSTISGGLYNTASGVSSTVSGGQTNTASGGVSTVSGGASNTASGSNSIVSGGMSNAASDSYSTVSGGQNNAASGWHSTVSGGNHNTASATNSTISGGATNTASGTNSTVSGGATNTASGAYSFAAGQGNTAQSYCETVLGLYATVGTGTTGSRVATDRLFVLGNGTASGSPSNALTLLKNGNMTVAGTLTTGAVTYPSAYGTGNQLLKMNAGGNALEWGTADGLTNFTESNYGNGTTINYGTKLLAKNDAQANVDFVIQPKGTGTILAQQPDGTAAGGNKRGANAVDLQTIRSTAAQVASGQFSTVCGGQNNTASEGISTVSGGQNNTAAGWASTVSGQQNVANGNSSFVAGDNNRANSFGETVFGLYATDVAGNPNSYIATDRLFVIGNGTTTGARSDALTLLKNGTMNVAGVLTHASDLRLKTAITDLASGMESINALRPVTYQKKSSLHSTEYGPTEIGFIAQEVREILPELVRESADEDKLLSVNYSGVVPVLVKALQEEYSKNEAQQKQIDELKTLVEQLLAK